MRLDEAAELLKDSVLHIGDTTFGTPKLHRAIKMAGYRFVRETNCSVAREDITITDATETLDITATVDGFEKDWFIRARIGYKPVERVPWQTIIYEFKDATPTGQPTLIAFDTPGAAVVAPQPDAGYTMVLTYRKPFLTFTAGAGNNPTLNIPDEWVYDVIGYGARGYLLRGAPGHPDAGPALDEFEKLIESARAKFEGVRSGIQDRNTLA